jgi:hypothetical protein
MIPEGRQDARRPVKLDVVWSIESQGISGLGTLLDMSRTGACVRINHPLTATTGLTFTLESEAMPSLPRLGRVQWYRRLPGRAPVFLCGLLFIHDKPDSDNLG